MFVYKRSDLLIFSGVVGKLVHQENYEKSMKKEGLPGSPVVKSVVLALRERLPQLILQDLKVFVEQYKLDYWLEMMSLKSESTSVLHWIDVFEEEGPKAFLSKYLDIFIKVEGEMTDQAVKKHIEQANVDNYSEYRPSFKAYLEFSKDIEVIHGRFVTCLRHIAEHSEDLLESMIPFYKEQEEKLLAYIANEEEFRDKLGLFQSILVEDIGDVIEVYMEPFFEQNLMFSMSKEKPALVFGMLSIRMFEERYAQDQMQDMLKCLADPTKMAIIQMTSQAPMCGKDLAKALKLSKATISHHISKLCLYGIIQVSIKDKKIVYYTLKLEVVENLFQGILNQLKPMEETIPPKKSLADFLDED